MSSNQICNIIRSENLIDSTRAGVSYEWDADGWLHVHGTQNSSDSVGVTSAKTPIHLEAGDYVMSAEVEGGGLGTYVYVSIWPTDDSRGLGTISPQAGGKAALSVAEPADIYLWLYGAQKGATVDYRMRLMLVEGDTPAAWAPAEGESLAGGGAQMSANLLEGVTPTLLNGTTESDGVWHNAGRTSTDGHKDWLVWDLAGQSALATNQTYHVGLSAKGASADADSLRMGVGYKDAAGHKNWVFTSSFKLGTTWQRFEGTAVVPSDMTPFGFYVAAYGTCPETWMTAATLSLGSPVTLASDAHTPYATQDHVAAEYATKAALKVTSDAVTAEVTERGKLAGRVGTLESTTGTHTSKLQQLAASITSLVKGESTYTDPDGKSATSGIYSLVTQTRDSVTALFGSYTKTADLASTQAVKDAKKAGTDAQAAASAAKSTADSLATMIREDSTGITVGKSADGQTWSTGHTRMTDSAFQVLDKAGATVAQMAKDGASFLAGLVRLQVHEVNSNSVVSMISDFLSIDSLWQAVMRAGKETSGKGYVDGYAAAIADVTGRRGSARLYCTQGNGSYITANNAFTVLPDGYDLSQPEYLAAALLGTGGGGSGVTHSQEGVPVTSSLDTCGPGVFSYNESTSGTPTSWGTCVCIRAGGGNWLFQLALPTVGDPHWRRNVNGAGWTSWWAITSQ